MSIDAQTCAAVSDQRRLVALQRSGLLDARPSDTLDFLRSIPEFGVIARTDVPLRLSAGEVLGSFCAIENEPREWTPTELESLETLLDAAMAERDVRETSRLLAAA